MKQAIDIENSITELVSDILDIDQSIVTNDLEYRGINEWDSLGHVNILMGIEEEYKVDIDDDTREYLTSIKAIKEYLYSKLEKNYGTQKDKTDTHQSKIYRGLAGVYYDITSGTYIDGNKGELKYRGINIDDLVNHSSFEETAYLLLYGYLPTKHQLTNFSEEISSYYDLPLEIVNVIKALHQSKPIDVLRTAISSMKDGLGNGEDEAFDQYTTYKKALAKVPLIVAYHHALRNGKEPISPKPELSYAANILYMLTGKIPAKTEENVMNKVLILQADHGSNASAFATRVAIGTGNNIISALTSAIATFSGPLHGGAIENVLTMIEEIGDKQNVNSYVEERITKNVPIMGFGHRVYKTIDPRAKHLKKAAKQMSDINGDTTQYDILDELINEMKPYSEKGLNINVDLFSSIIYSAFGLPKDIFISLFSIGRLPGWCMQAEEQLNNNILIRPLLKYSGSIEEPYTLLEERSKEEVSIARS